MNIHIETDWVPDVQITLKVFYSKELKITTKMRLPLVDAIKQIIPCTFDQ